MLFVLHPIIQGILHSNQEDALAGLVKHSPSGFALTRLFYRGTEFSGLDVKRVYFGSVASCVYAR